MSAGRITDIIIYCKYIYSNCIHVALTLADHPHNSLLKETLICLPSGSLSGSMIIQHQVIVSRVLYFDSIVIGRRQSCNSNFNYCNIVYTCMYVCTCIATKHRLMTDMTVVVSLSLSHSNNKCLLNISLLALLTEPKRILLHSTKCGYEQYHLGPPNVTPLKDNWHI